MQTTSGSPPVWSFVVHKSDGEKPPRGYLVELPKEGRVYTDLLRDPLCIADVDLVAGKGLTEDGFGLSEEEWAHLSTLAQDSLTRKVIAQLLLSYWRTLPPD